MTLARVKLWGATIGAVDLPDGEEVARFAYDPGFRQSGIQVAPLQMPLHPRIYSFPGLARPTFKGLPGLLADALPDRFGNDLIDAWLATQGRDASSFNAVERLCYIGNRGMGALEFEPASGPTTAATSALDVAELVALAGEVLRNRQDLRASFADPSRADALADILRVGTSAGGARPKALVAWNEATNEVRSGQVQAGPGFGYWLLKFDGVAANAEHGFTHGQGFGAIEYAYSLMAKACGIEMTACRMFEENGRRHFMTERFDRLAGGTKLHVQSLGGLAHLDFNAAGHHSYEQAFKAMRDLGLPPAQLEQLFRRMAFNVVARNQDDHVKNVAFIMDKHGAWRLSPAYDLSYSYNPDGAWTAKHQMSVNGKRDAFTRADFKACADIALLKRGQHAALLDEVIAAVGRWETFAEKAGVTEASTAQIQGQFRLELPAA